MAGLKLIVRAAPSQSKQGRHLQELFFRDKETKQVLETHAMNKTKATTATGESCNDVITFRRDAANPTERFDAGLQEQVANPFYVPYDSNAPEKSDRQVDKVMTENGLSEEWRKIIKGLVHQKSLSKQIALEIEAKVKPGHYTELLPPRLDGTPFFDPTKRTALSKFEVVLYDRDNIFTTDTARGKLAIQCIKRNSQVIAPSRSEVNQGVHRWYISEEFEGEKISKAKNDLVNEAIFELLTLQRSYPMTASLEENVIYMISSLLKRGKHPLVKGTVNPLFMDQQLNNYIKGAGDTHAQRVKTFLEVLQVFKTNPQLFHAKVIVQQAYNTNIVFDNNGSVFWSSMQHRPEWYKFDSREALEQFILVHFERYNPNEPTSENAYQDMTKAIKNKHGIVPKV